MSRFSKFILGSNGLSHLTEMSYLQILDELPGAFNAIDSALSYNNGNSLYDLFKKRNLRSITKVSPHMLKVLNQMLTTYLDEAGLSHIDLMIVQHNRGKWVELAGSMVDLVCEGHIDAVGVCDFTVEDLKKYYEVFKFYPDYIELEINPIYTPWETINFCKEHNIKIIAYGILGGKYNADRLIKQYTLSYAVSYAASIADHVIIRSDVADHLRACLMTEQLPDIKIEWHDKDCPPDIKCIKPLSYNPPFRMSVHNGVVIYEGNAWSDKSVSMKEAVDIVNSYQDAEIDMTDFLIDTADFEYISEYRAYLRTYLAQMGQRVEVMSSDFSCTKKYGYQIYLIDNDKLVKVKTPTSKIVVKQFDRSMLRLFERFDEG